ncbi:MAG: AraC family transcriptional regulator [Robiginitomaculum sp.]|nr:AraC family transcriptional regulator [Robiginitomaculum sp.]
MSTMSATYLFSYVKTCVELGASEDELLALIPRGKKEFTQNNSGQNTRRYPAELIYTVLAKAENLTSKPDIGLLCGNQIRPAEMMDLGHAILCCSSLRQAILTNIRYQPLTQQLGRSKLIIEGELAWLKWVPNYEDPEYGRRITDAVMAGHAGFGRWLSWVYNKKINAVHFRHAKPSYAKLYDDIFECPVLFGQADNAMIIDVDAIDTPLPQANAGMLAEICLRLDVDLAQLEHTGSFSELVTKVLRMDRENGLLNLAQTARHLGVSPRNLRRALAAEQTCFRTLLEQVRRDLCVQFLVDKMPLSEIAENLGYSQQSAFNRAFKAWYGDTPKAYMKAQKTVSIAFDQLAP